MGGMNVPGIVLHQSAQTQLETFLAAPAHAVLLGGPAGTGKTHVAAAAAAQLLDTTVDGLENHGYYRVVAPAPASISIEQIRELIGFFRLKVPGKGTIKRVAVIQDADSMGTEAQNALLKLLEEPPADSVLILTSSQPERLLRTIRSRVQLLQLPAPDAAQLRAHFAAGGFAEAAIASALLRAGTNVAEAERLLSAKTDASDTAVTLVKQALSGTSYDRLLLVEPLVKAKDKAQLHQFVDTLAAVATASLEAAARKGTGTVGRWQSVLQAAHDAQDALERSGNAKLVLTELMLAL
jgi:replication-associated recombination protein RarA